MGREPDDTTRFGRAGDVGRRGEGPSAPPAGGLQLDRPVLTCQPPGDYHPVVIPHRSGGPSRVVMPDRVRAFARPRTIFLAVLALSLSIAGLVLAQQRGREQKKYDKAQQREIDSLVKAVDDAVAGKPAPADFQIAFQNHFIKASDRRTFVPFSIVLDAKQVNRPALALYLRVVARAPAPAAAGGASDQKGAEAAKTPPAPVFETVHFLDQKAEEGRIRIVRALSAPPGEVDVYLAVKERADEKARNVAPKVAVVRQPLSVPDFWSGQLATSSVILAEKVEPLGAMPMGAEIELRPYAIGQNQITPSLANRFAKGGNLSIVFQIYNPQADASNKPDVTVEYNFHQKVEGVEKFFNRTNPQEFTAATLQPQFDLSQGHVIVAGQEIPLASFPEGDYRLEIKVTDRAAKKTLTQNVAFTVTP